MPTLHLIDGQSTQACPAVMSVLRGWLARGDEADRLLLLGGPGLEVVAKNAGISQADRVTPHYGLMTLVPRMLRRWMKTQPKFDRVHGWSVNALLTAGFVFRDTPMRITLVHTPSPNKFKQLRKFCKSPRPSPVEVLTHSQTLCDRLNEVGVKAQVDSSLTKNLAPPGSPPLSPSRESLRAGWHAPEENSRVVALLSDHPTQADAMDAAAIVCLAGASLTDDTGQPLGIRLVMHPEQINRQRAQYFLADQSDTHRVVQDVRAVEPWEILPGCDAALALGPDASGLSLYHALNTGTPVITAHPAIIDENESPPPHLHTARSSAHKDVAHQLHQAMTCIVT